LRIGPVKKLTGDIRRKNKTATMIKRGSAVLRTRAARQREVFSARVIYKKKTRVMKKEYPVQ